MTEPTMHGGECRCGHVRLVVSAPPLLTWACHCRGCQRLTASAFSLSVAIPNDGFAVVAGDPVIGGTRGAARHYFCPECMSWLFSRTEGNDRFVVVRPTMFDVADWSVPFVEVFTDEKLPWVTTPARHRFPGFPPVEAYPGLFAGYRAAGA